MLQEQPHLSGVPVTAVRIYKLHSALETPPWTLERQGATINSVMGWCGLKRLTFVSLTILAAAVQLRKELIMKTPRNLVLLRFL
jgi:hypothetical protein